MNEKQLLKLALVTSILGIFALFMIMTFSAEEVLPLNETDLTKSAYFYADVMSYKETDKVMMLDLKEIKSVKAVYFKKNADKIILKNGTNKFKGMIYNDNLIISEIIEN